MLSPKGNRESIVQRDVKGQPISGLIIDGNTKKSYLKGFYHCGSGPAVINADGSEEWLIDGWNLIPEEIEIAKGILSGKLLHLAPIYLNHKFLKYFCNHVLEHGPTRSL